MLYIVPFFNTILKITVKYDIWWLHNVSTMIVSLLFDSVTGAIPLVQFLQESLVQLPASLSASNPLFHTLLCLPEAETCEPNLCLSCGEAEPTGIRRILEG